MTKADSELLEQKRKLNERLDEVENKLAEQQHEKELKDWAPIPMQDFYDYMTEFVRYNIMEVGLEPWEFGSDDMDGIINVALRAGIRPGMPDSADKSLFHRIKLADEAREVFGGAEQ